MTEPEHNKNTQNLVDDLAQQLTPTKPVKTKWIWFWGLGPAAVILFTTLLGGLGCRRDLQNYFFNPINFMRTLALAITSIIASWYAIHLCIPGREPTKRKIFIPALITTTMGLFFVFHSMAFKPWHEFLDQMTRGAGCFSLTVIFALIPLISLSIIAARLAPFKIFWTSLLIGIASFSLAALGMDIHCGNDHGCHVGLWHYLPLLPGAILLAIPLQFLIRKLNQPKS